MENAHIKKGQRNASSNQEQSKSQKPNQKGSDTQPSNLNVELLGNIPLNAPSVQDEQKSSMPKNAYLVQPHKPPESKLCAFYAYYHYTDGKIDKNEFEAKVIEPYKKIGLDDASAKELYLDGNDPAIYTKFGLKETASYEKALEGDKLIVADVAKGHFYAIIKSKNTWWNYDSYHQTNPSKIGNFEQALTYLKNKGQKVWIS